MASNGGYELEGSLLEVCTCDVLCPCWIGEDPDNGDCESVVAYHFDKGKIRGIDVSGLTVASVDRHIAVPTAAAARAIATSPSGCATRWNATGATISGIDSDSPSTVVWVVQPATSTSTRGRSCQRRYASTFQRRVSSSPAPPA